MTKSSLLLCLTLLVLPKVSVAAHEPLLSHIRAGVVAGQVGLLGDLGSPSGSGFGWGALVASQISSRLALEASYLSSSHNNVSHRDFAINTNLSVGQFDMLSPFLLIGVSLIANKLDSPNVSGDAAAINLGGGFSFKLKNEEFERLSLGLTGVFQKALEAKTQINGVETKTVQDSYNILIRLVYSFAK